MKLRFELGLYGYEAVGGAVIPHSEIQNIGYTQTGAAFPLPDFTFRQGRPPH